MIPGHAAHLQQLASPERCVRVRVDVYEGSSQRMARSARRDQIGARGEQRYPSCATRHAAREHRELVADNSQQIVRQVKQRERPAPCVDFFVLLKFFSKWRTTVGKSRPIISATILGVFPRRCKRCKQAFSTVENENTTPS